MPWLLVTAVLVLGVVVAFVVLFLGGMLYLIGDLSRRLGPDQGVLVPTDGLEIGVVAPPLYASELRTKKLIDLAEFRGRPVVVALYLLNKGRERCQVAAGWGLGTGARWLMRSARRGISARPVMRSVM